jgi:hypothetical protein
MLVTSLVNYVSNGNINRGLVALLDREPESFETWVEIKQTWL